MRERIYFDKRAIQDIEEWGRRWRALPTRKEMAHKYGVSEGVIKRIANGHPYKPKPLSRREIEALAADVSRETTFSVITGDECTTAPS